MSGRDLLMLLATEPWWPAARIDPEALAELRHLGFVEDDPDSAPKSKQPIRLSAKGWAEMKVVRERMLDAEMERRGVR